MEDGDPRRTANSLVGPVTGADLDNRYETLCDPRLNARQALELAFRLSELMRA